MLYAVKISENRSVVYFENNMLDVADGINFLFTKEEAEDIAKRLEERYIYKSDIISERGDVFHHDFRKKQNPVKKMGLKIRL